MRDCTGAFPLSTKILVLEKEEDVCCGTSKANSAIIHAGHDAKPGSLKARFNVRGNELMDQLSADLDFPFTRNGSLVLCFEESQIPELEELADRGRKKWRSRSFHRDR